MKTEARSHPAHSPPLWRALEAAAPIFTGVINGQTPDKALAALPAELRPAVMDLVFNGLRTYGRGDFFLAHLISRPLKDTLIRSLLLIALPRLESHGEVAHTVVDQAVKAATTLMGGRADRYKGLVNGVLRNFLRRRDELSALASQDAVAHGQHPEWWIARLQADHPAHWQAILAAGNAHPPMSLRLNRRRQPDDFLHQLELAGIAAKQLDEHVLLLEKPVAVDRIPGFREGRCSVQDAGAHHAARLLDVHDHQRVLDACAAPGGKTAHLLELATLDLTALDADSTRAQRITANLDRLGLSANVKVAAAQAVASWWDGRPFDRILADVPCSASGVVRRHPDAKWLRRDADIAQFAATQAAIIDAVWQTLAHDGKMLYVTCSVFAQENQQQTAEFLDRHPDAHLQTQLELLPTLEHDGFYYALLQKD